MLSRFHSRLVPLQARLMSSHPRPNLGQFKLPKTKNEDFVHYAPGSAERKSLLEACQNVRSSCPEIPLIINGEEIRTGIIGKQVMPTDHGKTVCEFHQATPELVDKAIQGALKAKIEWEALPFEDRASVFLKAADLLSVKYRSAVCAAVMMGTGKNIWQAEIDAAVETIDFWRFNAKYAEEIYQQQPPENAAYNWNRMEYRALEGFIAAISPFNFLAIGSNLCCSPAQMGNVALWKPAETTILGSYLIYQILKEAGLPDGVIQFIPGDAKTVGNKLINSPDLAGLHFTGSTATFQHLWQSVAKNISHYKSYPRIVGETGGKNFHFIHKSAHNQIESIVNQTIRGAFEYNGQKCSATSRMYVPHTLWPKIKEGLLEKVPKLKMGQPDDPSVFVTAVINEASFDKITSYIDKASKSDKCKIIAGGKYDKSKGYFIEPTIIETTDPHYPTMKEELFGPVLAVYVYQADEYEKNLKLCDETSNYALTGALFATDRLAIEFGARALRNAAGNFYINDKSTGSIVGQQPFGGSRASGTNDKSGSFMNLLRWTSARAIKETFIPLRYFTYPSFK
jgi:1-pyrroline-5-carboxylate dehydrogenase